MNIVISLLLCAFSILPNVGFAASIKVHVTGIEQSKGIINVALFPSHSSDQFPIPSVAVQQLSIHADVKGVFVLFNQLKPDNYAISVWHDENDNNKLDRFMGIPSEPHGNSGTYTSFKPSFEASKFKLKEQQLTVEIEIH